MQHNHEMRYAIASVAHAMISGCEDPSKIMGGLHPLSLRTQVLLHIWSSTISPLCSEICSVWAKNELEAASYFGKIDDSLPFSRSVESPVTPKRHLGTRRLHFR